ncbi:hypothetical protein [Jannaschia sp. LMIT008]|uniref:hypothetical protein n=1 Tax=Jannaschia maritima TaxID=3032585 RepID=UPI002811E49A|nr:hypothetical protein [Jannaschia sp. LMIT008]
MTIQYGTTLGLASALAVLLSVTVLAQPAAALDCVPYRHGPLIERDLMVSQYRARGIEEDRPEPIRYDPTYEAQGAAAFGGTSAGPTVAEVFELSLATGLPFRGSSLDEDELRIMVTGVDLYPLAARLPRSAGKPPADRRLATDVHGVEYWVWEDYRLTGRDLPGGFLGVTYPGADRAADAPEAWARFDMTGDVSEIVWCKTVADVPNPQCELHVKIEPVFAETNFDRDILGQLPLIVTRARDFTTCLLEEPSDG